MNEEINGIKIQKLPTIGKALSYRNTRFRKSSYDLKLNRDERKKVLAIKKVLAEPEVKK